MFLCSRMCVIIYLFILFIYLINLFICLIYLFYLFILGFPQGGGL